jgi:uncharacterized membrane protein (DUF4010 family)
LGGPGCWIGASPIARRLAKPPERALLQRVTDSQTIVSIVAAAVGGLAVGLEREWSGHASGPQAHFGGIRTFALLGGLAGIAGWLWHNGDQAAAVVVLSAAALLVVAAYAAVAQRHIDATTEVAALVVLAAGFLAGAQHLAVASGVVAITVLTLIEKSRLHQWVAKLNDAEIRAAARFAVMAVVILPLLPAEAYGPFGGIRPRALWAVVLLFTGISFVGYIARRAVGGAHADALAGLLGGLVSSTQVTLVHARASRSEARRALPLACGAIAASTVLFVRTLFAATVLNPPLALALLPYTIPAFLIGLAAGAATLRRSPASAAALPAPDNPLQFRAALQMAAVFQLVIFIVHVLRTRAGDAGLIVTGAAVGLTDVDAATLSMARAVADGLAPGLAAQAVAAGILANTLLKLALALVVGKGTFRIATGAGLASISLALAAALALISPHVAADLLATP